MNPMALDDVKTHHDVAEQSVASLRKFSPAQGEGVSKYAIEVPDNGVLRALLVNKASDVLVVAFHGATSRAKKELPRFEWFRTLRTEGVSSLYFSDPLLETDATLELAWFTGRHGFDLHVELARLAEVAARAVGARRVIFLGSSGGGFAAMQIASHVPGSLALPFSPQTSLSKYLVKGTGYGAQRKYLKLVMPELVPDLPLEKLGPEVDWAKPLADRLSAVERYKTDQQNQVLYVQNINDVPHAEQHRDPFREVVEGGSNASSIRFEEYSGPEGHNPPAQQEFKHYLRMAIDWQFRSGSTR